MKEPRSEVVAPSPATVQERNMLMREMHGVHGLSMESLGRISQLTDLHVSLRFEGLGGAISTQLICKTVIHAPPAYFPPTLHAVKTRVQLQHAGVLCP